MKTLKFDFLTVGMLAFTNWLATGVHKNIFLFFFSFSIYEIAHLVLELSFACHNGFLLGQRVNKVSHHCHRNHQSQSNREQSINLFHALSPIGMFVSIL